MRFKRRLYCYTSTTGRVVRGTIHSFNRRFDVLKASFFLGNEALTGHICYLYSRFYALQVWNIFLHLLNKQQKNCHCV